MIRYRVWGLFEQALQLPRRVNWPGGQGVAMTITPHRITRKLPYVPPSFVYLFLLYTSSLFLLISHLTHKYIFYFDNNIECVYSFRSRPREALQNPLLSLSPPISRSLATLFSLFTREHEEFSRCRAHLAVTHRRSFFCLPHFATTSHDDKRSGAKLHLINWFKRIVA